MHHLQDLDLPNSWTCAQLISYGLWAHSDLWVNCLRNVRALEQSFDVNSQNKSIFRLTCVSRNSSVTFLCFQFTFWPLQGCTLNV